MKEYDDIKTCLAIAREQKKQLKLEILKLDYEQKAKAMKKLETTNIVEHLEVFNEIADVFIYNDP